MLNLNKKRKEPSSSTQGTDWWSPEVMGEGWVRWTEGTSLSWPGPQDSLGESEHSCLVPALRRNIFKPWCDVSLFSMSLQISLSLCLFCIILLYVVTGNSNHKLQRRKQKLSSIPPPPGHLLAFSRH